MINKILILIVLNVFSTFVCAEQSIVEVIPVFNRPASEIQPLLIPLLESSDRIIADGSNLLVRTSPGRLAEIKSLIQNLDKSLNNLVITVLQSNQTTAEEMNARARAQVNIRGNDWSKSTGKISAYYYQTQDRSASDTMQTIRTLEGNPAYIKAGSNVPVQNYQSYNSGYGYSGISTATNYIEATTGFQVTPRLSGQRVLLDVSPWSDRLNSQGQIRTQDVQSTLTVNLGEWIELGGINESAQSSGNRTLGRSWQTHDNQLHVLIKVDKSD